MLWNTVFVPIAGRKPNRWAHRVPHRGWGHHVNHYEHKVKFESPSRYYAVNLTNEKTVEIRMFRGTTKTETLLRYVECVELLLAYAKQPNGVTRRNLGVTLRKFYVAHAADYPHLDAFLKAEHLWCYAVRAGGA
jgi:hypothetical protein